MKGKTVLNNVILSIAVILAALAAAELFLHFFHPIDYRKPPEKLTASRWRKILHRPSPVPGLSYELTPNRKRRSHGALIKTNSWGMRDDDPCSGNNNSLCRIVILGDSYTFGFGVPGEYTYSNVLERLLNQQNTGRQYEVLNLGCGGYSTRDEALVLKYKGIKWKPKLVVIGYVLNDPEIDPIQPLHAYYQKPCWWQHLNLFRLAAKVKNRWDIAVLGRGDYYRYLHSPKHRKWKSVVKAFKEIDKLTRMRKIPVLLIIFPITTHESWANYPYLDLHGQVASAAKASGLYVIDLFERFSRHPPVEMMVNPGNNHPGETAHEIAAAAIFQWICTKKNLRKSL